MFTVREAVGLTSFLVGAAVLAAVSHHPTSGRRPEWERTAVQAAADHLTYDQIADAWMQARLGATASLLAITGAVGLPHRSTREDGDVIVLTFAGRGDRCLDLISTPTANTVETRPC